LPPFFLPCKKHRKKKLKGRRKENEGEREIARKRDREW
jgi:hypothetical protein